MSNWFTLQHLGSVVIAGTDAEAFAQAQLTIDMARMEPGRWYPAAWCDPKGRALCVMFAARRDGFVELVVPASQTELVQARLPMFAIGRDVELAPGGPVCGRFDHDRADAGLAFDPDRGLRLLRNAEHATPDQLRQWQLADLHSRIPWLSPETSARHLPQALGLEALDGISYSKGCYPGQEVIARVHFLGKVKYRIATVKFENARPVAAGARLVDENDVNLGELLWGVSGDGESTALAVVNAKATSGLECLARTDSSAVRGQVSL